MKVILTILMLLGGFNLFCEEGAVAKKETTSKWYVEIVKNLKIKLNKIINPQKSATISSVFGVRGNKYDSKNGLYWKSSNSEQLIDKIERDKTVIDEIVKKIEAGDIEEAKLELENFVKNNPNSYFIDEVNVLLKEIDLKKGIGEEKQQEAKE
ncbi:MAG: hypothetical protein K6357_00995 [Elusimicrobiota bacterium]